MANPTEMQVRTSSFESQASFPCVALSLHSHTGQRAPLQDCGQPCSPHDIDGPNQSWQPGTPHRGAEGTGGHSCAFVWGGASWRVPCLSAHLCRRACSGTCRRAWRRRSRSGRPKSAPRRRSSKRYSLGPPSLPGVQRHEHHTGIQT